MGHTQAAQDYSHPGFALDSRTAVDAVADQACAAGDLVWEPRQEPSPVAIMRPARSRWEYDTV
jgi:hypothetical protein